MAESALAPARALLRRAFAAGLQAVDGERCTRAALGENPPPPGPLGLVAVGKAAAAMWRGAWAACGGQIACGLLVTKHGHAGDLEATPPFRDGRARVIEAGHPVPDARSLAAGEAVLAALADPAAPAHWLFLISGGASALLEAPRAGWSLAGLQALNRRLLASGLPIGTINAVRRGASRIKAGGLAEALAQAGRSAEVLLISDVPGDDPAVIGSGPLMPSDVRVDPDRLGLPDDWPARLLAAPPTGGIAVPPHRVVAGLDRAMAAVEDWAARQGLPIRVHPGRLAGEVGPAGEAIAGDLLQGPPGLQLWGGELTPRLPPQPGQGGRCQHLALLLARRIAGRDDLCLLAAGSDGSDGPTEAAGALIDGGSRARIEAAGLDIEEGLRRADSHRLLAAAGDLFRTGPTGTNVTDLVIGLRLDDALRRIIAP